MNVSILLAHRAADRPAVNSMPRDFGQSGIGIRRSVCGALGSSPAIVARNRFSVALATLVLSLLATPLQLGAMPLLAAPEYRPVAWGPAAVSSQFIEYSVQVSSTGVVADQQFLNVVRADGTWVVQNLPVGFEPGTRTMATNIDSALFSTGASYQTFLSAGPETVAPVYSSGVMQGLGATVNYLANDGNGVTEDGAFVGPGTPSTLNLSFGPVVSSSYHIGMPDLDQGDNECMPTSAANSLTWLNNGHNLGLTQTTEEIRDILADMDHMNTDPMTGTSLPGFLGGKNRFVSEHMLPIVTHRVLGGPIGTPSLANIMAEMAKGQDVELLIRWGTNASRGSHMVTLVSVFDLGQFGAGIGFNDPADGADQTVWSWLDTTSGGFLRVRSYGADNPGNIIRFGIAESVPEPGSLALVLAGLALLLLARPRRSLTLV